MLAIMMVTLLIDQGTKLLALRYLEPETNVPLLGNFFYLRLIGNPGAALSFLANHTWIFTLISLVAVVAVAYYSSRVTSKLWAICLGAVGGGAAGNLVDRLTQPPGFAQGHVVDFIGYGDFFVGNVADIFIVVAVIAMVLLTLKSVPIHEASASDCKTDASDSKES